MGFSCINKNNIVSQEVIEKTNLLRSSGLSNVYNMNPEAIFCTEVFEGPEYYVTGATMLITGLTQTLTGCTTGTTAVYNLTYTPEFDVSFIITGGTKYTGYTGNFCYKVFSDNQFSVNGPIRGLVDGTEFINNCFAFSAITSTTLTQQFLEGSLSNTWGQYMIRPYYTFVSKECSPGLYFDTWKSTTQLNLISDTDFYFMTVVDPPVPILQAPFNTPQDPGFISDLILHDGVTTNPTGSQALNGELNYFNLTSVPTSLNSVIVFVNGVALTPWQDYQLVNYGGFGVPPTLIFQGVEINGHDWIVAYYPTGTPPLNFNNNGWSVEPFKIDSSNFVVNIGNPGLGTNYLNFNTITGKQEIFLKANIAEGDTPILFVNGTQLAYGYQFFKSNTIGNRLILNEALIHIGDIVSIFYNAFILTGNDYGSLSEPKFTLTWFVPGTLPNNVIGEFIVNMYDKDDTSNTIMYQKIQPFINGQANYSETINNLALNINYRFEVIYQTIYTTYMNNEVTTCSIVNGFVNTKGPVINNTY